MGGYLGWLQSPWLCSIEGPLGKSFLISFSPVHSGIKQSLKLF